MKNDDRLMKRRSRYDAQLHHADYFTIRALQRFLRRSITRYVRTGFVVLDAGCGEQPLRAAVEAQGARYLGFDIVPHAETKVHALADVTALPLRDESCAVVICSEVIEHLYDAPSAIIEAARVLTPGGVLILTVPFFYPLHEEPHDFGRPTRFALEESCHRAGLHIVEMHLLGDEMQATASLLDNTLTRITLSGAKHQVWRAARVPLRLAGNMAFGALSYSLRRSLPRKAYLGHALVARKPDA